jgi:type I restriction enzyme S subunit
MSELPQGWAVATLGEVARYINGRAFKPAEWTQVGSPIVRIQNLTNSSDSFNYTDQRHEEKYRLKNGDLLIAWSASLGAFIWTRGEAWLNQHIFRVEPYEKLVTKEFLYYAATSAIRDLYNKAHGTGMVHVTKPVFESHQIQVPPLNEQRRIVTKVEKLLKHVDAAQERLATIPHILRRFRQSVLAAACSGKLTSGWRSVSPNSESATSRLEKIRQARLVLVKTTAQAQRISDLFSELCSAQDVPLPTGWLRLSAESICDFITKGTTPNTKEITSDGDVPFLKVQHIVDNKLEFSSLPCFVPREVHNGVLKRSKVFPRDVLMNIVGPPLNKVAIVPNDFPEWNINQALAIFRPVAGIEPEYLQLILTFEGTLEHVLRETRGVVGQSNISLEQCRDLMIVVPSLAEQQEIIRRVEALFKTADALEARYRKAKAHVDKLTPSILARAFRGELVAQDPDDEPASVLLDRIRKGEKPQEGKNRSGATPQSHQKF